MHGVEKILSLSVRHKGTSQSERAHRWEKLLTQSVRRACVCVCIMYEMLMHGADAVWVFAARHISWPICRLRVLIGYVKKGPPVSIYVERAAAIIDVGFDLMWKGLMSFCSRG